MTRRLIGSLSILALCLTATACTHVRPHERETHARIQAQLDERAAPVGDFEAHVWTVREGAAGGSGQAGGGCGCN